NLGDVVEASSSSPSRLGRGEDRDEEVAALPLEGGTFMRFSFVAFDKDEGRRHLRPSAKNVEEAESPPGC
ncbi:hypothetical protein BHM03_00010040, partial [Ensete ventricosum]